MKTDVPSDVQLTRVEKQILQYVQAHPGCTAFDVAPALDKKTPYYALDGLKNLLRLNWVQSDKPWYCDGTWRAVYPEGD